MALRKMMLIVNPAAGRRASERALARVCRVFLEHDWLVTTFITGKRGEAIDYARQFAGDFERIACMGGDGTLNETINGLMQSCTNIPLAFIPCGSTNDFATTHGISANPEVSALQAVEGKETPVDICRLNERYFAFHSAFGYFASVVNSAPQDSKNILGYLAYILEGAKDITKLRPVHCIFRANGKVHEGDYIYGGCMSTLSLGGNILSLTEDQVKLDDGRFEALLIKAPQDIIEFGETISDLSSSILNGAHTDFFEFTEAFCEFNEDPSWCIDGEPYSGPLTTSLEVLRKKLIVMK